MAECTSHHIFILNTKMSETDMVSLSFKELSTAAPLQTFKRKIKDTSIFNFSCFFQHLRKKYFNDTWFSSLKIPILALP